MTSLHSIRSELEDARSRFQELRDISEASRAPELLEDFGNALEELHVAVEELQEQGSRLEAEASERIRFHALFELTPAAYFLTGPEGIIHLANFAAGRLTGYRPESLTGKPVFALMTPGSQREMRERVARLGRGDEDRITDGHVRFLRSDRGETPVSVDVAAVHAPSGERPELLWSILPAAAEERDPAERHVLARVLGAMDEGVLVVDGGGRVVGCNPAFARILGVSPDRLESITAIRALAMLASALLGNDPFDPKVRDLVTAATRTFEDDFRLADGRIVRVHKWGFGDDSARRGAIFIVREIAGEVATKDELSAAKQAAERTAEHRRRWLAMVSHEIRNPLTTLLGMTTLLAETPLDGHGQELLAVIERSGRAVLTLVEDLLDVAQIDAGRLDLRPVDFDLAELVEDLARDLSARARRTSVEVVWRVAPELPERVFGDARRLRQALSNVGGNALKVTQRGLVTLAATPDAQTGSVRFTISDTGPGVEKERLASIFERFAPGGETRDQAGGTGLGLWITKAIVERMGGSVELESTPGSGSRFTLRVPLSPLPAAHGTEPALTPFHALVVEDRSPLGDSIAELLRSWEATVTESLDGALAIAELGRRGSEFDVILLDIRLGGDQAFAVLEHLRSAPELMAKTIVLLPMRHRREDVERLKGLRIAGWILTPIKRKELLDRIDRIRSTSGA